MDFAGGTTKLEWTLQAGKEPAKRGFERCWQNIRNNEIRNEVHQMRLIRMRFEAKTR